MKIKVAELENLILQVLRKKYSEEHSKTMAKIIMFGEMSGKKSHGIPRLMIGSTSMMAQEPAGEIEIIEKTKLSKVIDAHKNPAMLVASIATDEVINLASDNGFGIVGTKGTYSTSGCLSYYLEKIAKSNLIGVVMARSPLVMAPFNTVDALFGTNPIGFAIPSDDYPVIFDMGTSAISYGELIKANETENKIPEGVAIDSEGNMTTDPQKAMDGAVLGFDKSYKSSGLSMMVEILSGLWPGAGYINSQPNDWGNTFIAFKPDLLLDTEEFKQKITKFIERLKQAKTKDGNEVRISGEKTLKTRDESLRSGDVEVADELLEKLREATK